VFRLLLPALLACALLAGCGPDEPPLSECPSEVVTLARHEADEMFLSVGQYVPEKATPALRDILEKQEGTATNHRFKDMYQVGTQCVVRFQVDSLLLEGGRVWSGHVLFLIEMGPPPEIVSIDEAS
jgi:hypothetical protein